MHTDRSCRFSIRADAWKFPFFPSGMAKDESREVLMLRPRETFSELCSVLVLVLLAVSLNWSYNMPVVNVQCVVAVIIDSLMRTGSYRWQLLSCVQIRRYPQNSEP
jgi:hypothetical protein